MGNSSDKFWMTRALELAIQGKSKTQPNPMVGCVIVLDGKAIGEGFHEEYGGPHAEVNAINSIKDQNLDLSKATAYVSLEPCSHFGLTPPCANLLAEKGIGRVVTAMEDPNPKVKGKGHKILESKNIKIESGVLEEHAREMNRIFCHLQNSPLPYITLKWAQSKDSFIDPDTNASTGRGSFQISSGESSELVQHLRSHHNAILVGRKTVEVDTPKLTAREQNGVDPKRLVIDPQCKLESDYFDVVICNSGSLSNAKAELCLGLEKGLKHVLKKLRELGVYSILVEGGARTLQSFIDNEVWDEAYVFESSKELKHGLKAPQIDLSEFDQSAVGPDTLYHLIK